MAKLSTYVDKNELQVGDILITTRELETSDTYWLYANGQILVRTAWPQLNTVIGNTTTAPGLNSFYIQPILQFRPNAVVTAMGYSGSRFNMQAYAADAPNTGNDRKYKTIVTAAISGWVELTHIQEPFIGFTTYSGGTIAFGLRKIYSYNGLIITEVRELAYDNTAAFTYSNNAYVFHAADKITKVGPTNYSVETYDSPFSPGEYPISGARYIGPQGDSFYVVNKQGYVSYHLPADNTWGTPIRVTTDEVYEIYVQDSKLCVLTNQAVYRFESNTWVAFPIENINFRMVIRPLSSGVMVLNDTHIATLNFNGTNYVWDKYPFPAAPTIRHAMKNERGLIMSDNENRFYITFFNTMSDRFCAPLIENLDTNGGLHAYIRHKI